MISLKLFTFCLYFVYSNCQDDDEMVKNKGGFYAFSVPNIQGDDVSLEDYRGKISLVVNVASECGYTDIHYEQMVALYNQIAVKEKQPFTILAFPCNQFGQQEPYKNAQILSHVQSTYGVSFPIFGKIKVTDHDVHPAFQYLARNSGGVEPTWNFWKYLVNEDGAVIKTWGPRINVNDIKEDIEDAINQLKMKHNEL